MGEEVGDVEMGASEGSADVRARSVELVSFVASAVVVSVDTRMVEPSLGDAVGRGGMHWLGITKQACPVGHSSAAAERQG